VSIVEKSEAGRINLCELLEGETLFSALYGVYTLAFAELKKVLKNSKEKEKNTGISSPFPKPAEGLKEQKRKRSSCTEGDRPDAAMKQGGSTHQARTTTTPKVRAPSITTRNFCASNRIRDERRDKKQG
jgi:hypothetical protein